MKFLIVAERCGSGANWSRCMSVNSSQSEHRWSGIPTTTPAIAISKSSLRVGNTDDAIGYTGLRVGYQLRTNHGNWLRHCREKALRVRLLCEIHKDQVAAFVIAVMRLAPEARFLTPAVSYG